MSLVGEVASGDGLCLAPSDGQEPVVMGAEIGSGWTFLSVTYQGLCEAWVTSVDPHDGSYTR